MAIIYSTCFTFFLLLVLLTEKCSFAEIIVGSETVSTNYDNANKTPLQVFILAGQSNMAGMGSIDHMDLLIQENYNTTIFRDTLWDVNRNEYKQRTDVYMKYDESHGPLTLGRTTGFAAETATFGTEVMFGWTVGDALTPAEPQQQESSNSTTTTTTTNNVTDPKILLIKVAWGGRDLAVDFRPPSSGEASYNNVKPIQYGMFYRQMIMDTLDTLDNLDQYIPSYNANGDDSYEIKGLVWFQGWNDMIDAFKVQEYAFNLANFIRDVRLDLDVPNMPVVVGELGMHGLNYTGSGTERVMEMRAAQRLVCQLPEFVNNTKFVPTAQHAVLDGQTYNGAYHYNGRADTYFYIGRDFGQAMLELLEESKSKQLHEEAINKTREHFFVRR